MNVEELNKELQQKRQTGRVTIYYKSSCDYDGAANVDTIRIIDDYVASLGFHAIGSQWRIINRGEAQKMLQKVIGYDLAYGHQLMSLTDSESLAHSFLSFFSSNTLFCTNGAWDVDNVNSSLKVGPSWTPLTASTFDTGVVGISPREIGLLWIEDED